MGNTYNKIDKSMYNCRDCLKIRALSETHCPLFTKCYICYDSRCNKHASGILTVKTPEPYTDKMKNIEYF